MARIDTLYHAFNVGVFDRDKLHRIDVDRTRLAAERQTNIMSDVVGRGFLRPGTQYIATAPGHFRPIEMIAANSQAAILVVSNLSMGIMDGVTDAMVSRVAVSTAVQNGTFAASTGWTLAATSGQASTISGNKLNLIARAHGGLAKASQTVTVSGGDVGVEHALRVVVDNGPVVFKVGSSAGADDYVATTDLRKGAHSLAFTPTGNFYIEFSSALPILKIVSQCSVEGAGVVALPSVWASADLGLIRTSQSLDVLFCAAAGYKEQRIERRSQRSWSVCDYDRADGPFQAGPSANVTLAPSVTEGNGTLTASGNFFKPGHVGALFWLFHNGQVVNTYLAADNQFTPAINITGITETNFEERKYTYQISGTWAATLRNGRSFDGEDGDYVNFRQQQAVATIDITSNVSFTNDDNDDNIDEWVRIGIPSGLYTSGEAAVAIQYPNGGGFGVCRVTGYTSATSVNIEVLTEFKGTGAVSDWREGRWDGVMGYPSTVGFDDGRIVWTGSDLLDASVSDAYESFDETVVGDSGPLSRSVALGGRNETRWSLPMSTFLLGCDLRIANVLASSLGEILTPSNFGVKNVGNIGAAALEPAELADDRVVFVQNSGTNLYEITWDYRVQRYGVAPLTVLTNELFQGGILNLSKQTLPNQRIWIPTLNGDAVMIVYEPAQQVLAAHIPISTSNNTDFFEDFAVLPAPQQDRVYAAVRRVVNSSTIYTLEKFAMDTEAKPATVCKVMDSHVTGTGAHSTTISLPHLIGRTVVAWVDGAPVLDATITDPALDNAKTFVVDGAGHITLPVAPTAGWCVGLPYDGQYKTSRLAYGVDGYTPMLKNKALAAAGLLLADCCRSGIRYGVVRDSSFSTPWSLPLISSATGTLADEVTIGPLSDEVPFEPGTVTDLDVRLCIALRSPKPATMLSLVLAIETS